MIKTDVKAEPFCYAYKNTKEEFERGLSSRVADFQDYYWSIPLYLHPPAASDVVERIRALEIAEPIDWVDKRHNALIQRVIAIIEGAK